MSRNYQRNERDWRRHQPSWQEEDQWARSRSDDDFSMGLGQESRGDRWDRRDRRPQSEALDSAEDNRGPRSGGSFRGSDVDYNRDSGRFDDPYRGPWQRSEGQFAGRGPRNYKRSDERIEEDINERLTQHGTIDATDIEVSVQNAEVTLRGSVDNRQAKRLAEDIADAVSGVKDVHNQIKVKSGEGKRESETGGKQRKAS